MNFNFPRLIFMKFLLISVFGFFSLGLHSQESINKNYEITGIKECLNNQATFACFKSAAEKIRIKMILSECPKNPTAENIQEIAACQSSKKIAAEDLVAKITGYDLLNRSPDQFMSEFKDCDSVSSKCKEILKSVLMNQLDMRCERQSSGDQSILSKCKRNGITTVMKKAEEATLSDDQARIQKVQNEYNEVNKKFAEIKANRRTAIKSLPFESFDEECLAEWTLFLKNGERKEITDENFRVKFDKTKSVVSLNGMNFLMQFTDGYRHSEFTQINKNKDGLDQKKPFAKINGESYIVALGNFDMAERSHKKFAYSTINVSLGNYYEDAPVKEGDFLSFRVDYHAPVLSGNLSIACAGLPASNEEKLLEKKLAELTKLRQSLLPDSSPKEQLKTITQ